MRNNKQTHKLEFYLNIHETRYKKRPRGDLQKKFLSKSLFIRIKKKKNDLLFSPKLAIYGTSFDKAF